MKAKTLTYAGIVLIVLLFIISAIAFITNSKNKRNYNEAKLQNESVSAQKLQVSQELDKAKNDLASLTTKEESDLKAIAEKSSGLAEAEKRIAHMSKENSSLMKERNELTELKKSKSELDKAYEDLKLKQETASSRIKDLENAEILLDARLKEISGNLANAEKYRTDNIEIYGSRGNKKDKLTFFARRTKKLNINFDVPQSLTEAISFKIITPAGATITPEDKALTWLVEPVSGDLTASLSLVSGEIETSRKVAMTYSPKEKLKAGEYKIQIFSDGRNVGNCRLKLR